MAKIELKELQDIFKPIENVIALNDAIYTANPVFIRKKVAKGINTEDIQLSNKKWVRVQQYSPIYFSKTYAVAYQII